MAMATEKDKVSSIGGDPREGSPPAGGVSVPWRGPLLDLGDGGGSVDDMDEAEIVRVLAEAKNVEQRYKQVAAVKEKTRSAQLLRRHSKYYYEDDIRRRIRNAVPCSIYDIDWSRMMIAVSVEELQDEEHAGKEHAAVDSNCDPSYLNGTMVEISSGGTVFFVLMECDENGCMSEVDGFVSEGNGCMPGKKETCIVMKFVSDRLLAQSEQFAAELANHLRIPVPDTRVVHYNTHDSEWKAVMHAAASKGVPCEDLCAAMMRPGCLLVLEYIPGRTLFESMDAFVPERIQDTSFLLGKIFALDMILGNPDRLQCTRLGWSGNKNNLIFATGGRFQHKVTAIDAVVQRRPPFRLLCKEDDACEELAELCINHVEVVRDLLKDALKGGNVSEIAMIEISMDVAAACQRGMKETLVHAISLRGIFEMMQQTLRDWVSKFLDDMEGKYEFPLSPREQQAGRQLSPRAATPTSSLSSASFTTSRIRSIQKEAAKDDSIKQKLRTWNTIFGEKAVQLKEAVEDWQARNLESNGSEDVGIRLTTGFLDGIRPIVDLYELNVRLEHMLRRFRVLQQALSSGTPNEVIQNVYVGGAVEANSFHVLRYLGITHVLNATDDLFLEGDPRSQYITENFTGSLRIPLQDEEDECVDRHFEEAADFIHRYSQGSFKILVHCHAGQSRSCCLIIAFLLLKRDKRLKSALDILYAARPQAAPNAGYMNSLALLEEKIHGKKINIKCRRSKPLPKSCHICHEEVGLSSASVRVHIRLKHPKVNLYPVDQ